MVLLPYGIYGKCGPKKDDERLDPFLSFGLKLLGLHEGGNEVKERQ
jgi:hypothetical protein